MILGISEYLKVGLPKSVLGVGAEPAPQVCSGCRFKLERAHTTGQVVVPVSLDPVGPSYLVVGADVVPSSSPVILGMLEYLEVDLPLGVVGLVAKLVPKVSSRHHLRSERL